MGMELIETIEVGSGGVAAIEFTSIPQDGLDLILLLSSRADNAEQAFFTTLNNTTGYNYPQSYIAWNGSSAQSGSRDDNGFYFQWHNKSSTFAGIFSNSTTVFSNYASSSDKSFSIQSVAPNDSNSLNVYMFMQQGTYESTSGISSIKFTQQASGNFVQYTIASLYKTTAD